jgi:hypothetical protein
MTNALAGLALALAFAADDATAFRWKLAKGDTFYTRTATELKQTVSALGNDMEQTQTTTVVYRYRVLEAGDKGTVLEQTVVRAEIRGNLPMAEGMTDRMKGLTLTYTLDDKKQVTKLEGREKYIAALAGDDEDLQKLFKATMTEDNLKMGVQELFGFVPQEPVKPGDTWKREYKMSLGPIGEFAMTGHFKYAGSADGLEKVTYTADAKFSPPGADADAGLPFAFTKGELKAEKFEGTLLFDPKAGRPKEGRSEARFGGKLTVSVNQMEVEMDFRQALTTVTTVSASNLADD